MRRRETVPKQYVFIGIYASFLRRYQVVTPINKPLDIDDNYISLPCVMF